MRNVLRSCNGLYFREDFSYQKCFGCSTSWHRRQLGRCGNPRACETRTKQEASRCLEEWLLPVFLRRNGGKVFTEMAKGSPVVHLAGSLIRIDFCFSVYLSPLPTPCPPLPPPALRRTEAHCIAGQLAFPPLLHGNPAEIRSE